MKFEIINQWSSNTKLNRAEKYVKRLKSWYWFIPVNIMATVLLSALSFLMHQNGEPNTIIWIMMSNVMGLWVIFIVEGVALRRPRIVRSWEQKRIKKIINKENP